MAEEKESEFDISSVVPVLANKEMQERTNHIVEDLAKLFKGMDDFSKSTLGFSIIIFALLRRKELDDEEKEKSEKK